MLLFLLFVCLDNIYFARHDASDSSNDHDQKIYKTELPEWKLELLAVFLSLSLADLGYVVTLLAATSHRLLSLLDRELGQYWKVRALHTVVAVSRGFVATSNVLTMIISLERCACVLAPLHARRIFRTRSMAVVIVAVFVFVLGLYGLFNLKYVTVVRIDPSTNTTVYESGLGEVYLQNRSVHS